MPDHPILKTAILGASGYTGAELVRLGLEHPAIDICLLSAERKAGEGMATVFPHLDGYSLPPMVAVEAINWPDEAFDIVFCALPHATSQRIIADIFDASPAQTRVIDLSADFRLRDPATYANWYGNPHVATDLQTRAVYGLSEFYRDDIKGARLVACPGCYPTAALLALLPLISQSLISIEDIIIDAKSGVTGAGRSLKETNLFSEVAEAMHPYGVGHHRHMPEIEQELSSAVGRDVTIGFTPHLVPMNRGELETIYVRLADGIKAADLRAALMDRYHDEPFVRILPEGQMPATRIVRGSNHCVLQVVADRIAGRAIVIVAIDNLVKGSSGQAIQNMNLMTGLPETLGLTQLPLMP